MLFVDYGLVSAQRTDGDRSTWRDIYDDVVAMAGDAERAGFDGLWVTEHHLTADGYMSALFPVLAALAVSTERLVLGTNVALAPLYHPLRLAEDAAAVSILSHGRLLLGLAIGYRDEEFDVIGVPKRERVPRLVECVELCRKAWTGEPFDHDGPVVRARAALVRPVPEPAPPIWLGGWVEAGIRRAAQLGDGYISPGGGLDDTRRRVAVLDAAAEAAGRAAPLPIATANWVVLGEPRPSVLAGIAHMRRNYGEWYSSSSDEGGGRAVGHAINASLATKAGGLPPGVIGGGTQQVIDALAPLATAFSSARDHRLAVRLQYPGMARAEVVEHVQRFAEEVLPALRR